MKRVLCNLMFVLVAFTSVSAQQAQTVQVSTAQANVRLEPNRTSMVVARPPVGTILEVVGVSGDWVQVKLPKDSSGFDRVGYILKSLTKATTTPASVKAPKAIAVAAPTPPKQIKVAVGTEVKLRVMTPLSSGDAKVGEEVDLRVAGDVLVDGEVVIKQDTIAAAHLTKVTTQKLRRPGTLEFAIESVPAVNNEPVQLKGIQVVTGTTGRIRADEANIADGTVFSAVVDTELVMTKQPTLPGSKANSPTNTPMNAGMTNVDVVQLVRQHLGDQVIVAKINQTQLVNFQLDNQDLAALKQAGVSETVIAAMLNRSSTQVAPSPGIPFPGMGGMPGGNVAVRLLLKDGEHALHSIAGDRSSTYAYVTVLQFMDYPGLRATVRTSEHSVVFMVTSAESPVGRFYIVKTDPDSKKAVRSVKLGRSRMFSQDSVMTPDSDWTIPFVATQVGQSVWRLTVQRQLRPGEYGIYIRNGDFYDFGVD